MHAFSYLQITYKLRDVRQQRVSLMCTHVKRSFQYVLVLSMMPRSYVYLHKITLARQILLPVIYHNFLSGQHLSLLMYLLCTVGNNGTCTHPLLRPILAQKIYINKFLTYPNLFYPDGQITVVFIHVDELL